MKGKSYKILTVQFLFILRNIPNLEETVIAHAQMFEVGSLIY